MTRRIKLFDIVAVTTDLPEVKLEAGEVGTVVEEYEGHDAYEVEFINDRGETVAMETIEGSHLLVLRKMPRAVA